MKEAYFNPEDVFTALVTWSEFYDAVKPTFDRAYIRSALLSMQYGDFLGKYKDQYRKETGITLYLRPNSNDIETMVNLFYEHYKEERERCKKRPTKVLKQAFIGIIRH